MKTPIKLALKRSSSLQVKVRERLGAVEAAHKHFIDEAIRASFADSLDIDDGLKGGNYQANRWDYLLGHQESSLVVGVEPHSAHTGEASVVIAKKNAARQQLRSHLNPGSKIAAWFWIA